MTEQEHARHYEYELRACPQCGEEEPVTLDVLARANREGWPDVWLCFACAVNRELTTFPATAAGGGK